MEPLCKSALASPHCFGLYALLMLTLGAFPALMGSIAVAVLSSRLSRWRIIARVAGVWLTAFASAVSVTAYLAFSDYVDAHSDTRVVGTTFALIFLMVTAYVVIVTRRGAAPEHAEAPG
jgi:hypothetical protein